MYCRICGTEQTESINYCSHDGAMTDSLAKNVILEKEDSTFCRSCGEQNEALGSYCGKCGESLLKVGTTVLKGIADVDYATRGVSSVKLSVLQHGLLGGIIASFIMLVTGWIGNFLLINISKQMLKNMFHFADVPFELNQILEFFSRTSNTILNFHLLGISMEGMGEEVAIMKLDIPFFFFICIPLFVLGGVGFWMQKKYHMSSMLEKWITSLGTGLIYGLFLMIVSFTAGHDVLVMKLSYSFAASFVAGIIYGTVFSFVGMLLYAGRFDRAAYMEQTMPFGASIYYGVKAAITGFAVATIVSIGWFITIDKPDSLSGLTYSDTVSEEVITAMQIAPKAWGMAHLAPVKIESDPLGEEMYTEFNETFNRDIDPNDMYIQISYVSGLSVAGMSPKELLMAERATLQEVKEAEDLNSIFHWGLVLTVIPVLFMFLAGRKLAYYQSQNPYIPLAVMSAAYSLIAIMINMLSSIKISGETTGALMEFIPINGTLVSVQNDTVYLLLFSFVIAYLAAFAGMKVAKR